MMLVETSASKKKVLAAFNKLTPNAVYERTGKFWRDLLTTDQPGRQQ